MTKNNDNLSVSSTNQGLTKKKRVLLTLLPIRQKYLSSFGDLNLTDHFDLILDATGVVAADGGSTIYDDEIIDERIIKINSVSKALAALDSLEIITIDFFLVFRPRYDAESLEIIDALVERSKKWALLANKRTLREPLEIIRPFNYIKLMSSHLEARRSTAAQRRRPDVAFTNCVVANKKLFRHFIPKRIAYVPHMDARADPDVDTNVHRIGVFLDQYLPFHTELQYKLNVSLDALQYYSALTSFFTYAKKKYGLDEIIFCRHPNSLGKELSYLKDCLPSYGESFEKCAVAQVVFGHYSNSLNFALQLGKPIVLVRFGNGLLPEVVEVAIEKRAQQIGAEVVTFHDDFISHNRQFSLLRNLRNLLNNKFVLRSAAEKFSVQWARFEM